MELFQEFMKSNQKSLMTTGATDNIKYNTDKNLLKGNLKKGLSLAPRCLYRNHWKKLCHATTFC